MRGSVAEREWSKRIKAEHGEAATTQLTHLPLHISQDRVEIIANDQVREHAGDDQI